MALKASELKVGDTYSERLVEDLKRTQIVQYAGASGDYNPLHTDEPYTREAAGYPSTFFSASNMSNVGIRSKVWLVSRSAEDREALLQSKGCCQDLRTKSGCEFASLRSSPRCRP